VDACGAFVQACGWHAWVGMQACGQVPVRTVVGMSTDGQRGSRWEMVYMHNNGRILSTLTIRSENGDRSCDVVDEYAEIYL